MPRSAAQSDFVVAASPREEWEIREELRETPPPPAGPIGDGTAPVELPRATVRSRFASARATRVVMTFTLCVLALLVLLTLIGPHIPTGE